MTTHLETNRINGDGKRVAACGTPLWSVSYALTLCLVKCKRCKRTIAYEAAARNAKKENAA